MRWTFYVIANIWGNQVMQWWVFLDTEFGLGSFLMSSEKSSQLLLKKKYITAIPSIDTHGTGKQYKVLSYCWLITLQPYLLPAKHKNRARRNFKICLDLAEVNRREPRSGVLAVKILWGVHWWHRNRSGKGMKIICQNGTQNEVYKINR